MNSADLVSLNNFQTNYSKDPILLKDYNGLVSDVQNESIESRIQMFERVANKNRSKSGIEFTYDGLQNNRLFQVFLCKENIQIIQNALRKNVYDTTQYIIPPQNIDELLIIMRSIFLQNGNFNVNVKNITEEIEKLNNRVLDYVVPQLISSLKSYLYYIQNQANLPVPIRQPVQVDRDFKQMEVNWFL